MRAVRFSKYERMSTHPLRESINIMVELGSPVRGQAIKHGVRDIRE
jgi:hypothetical protein